MGLPGSSHPSPRKHEPSRRIFLTSDNSEVEIIETTSVKTPDRSRTTDIAFKGKAVLRDDDPIQVSDDDDAIMVL